MVPRSHGHPRKQVAHRVPALPRAADHTDVDIDLHRFRLLLYDDGSAAEVACKALFRRLPQGNGQTEIDGRLPGFPEGSHDVPKRYLRHEIVATRTGEVPFRLVEVELRVVHVPSALYPDLASF